MVLPFMSVMFTLVLLKVAIIFTIPCVIFLLPLALRIFTSASSLLRRSSAVSSFLTGFASSASSEGVSLAAGASSFTSGFLSTSASSALGSSTGVSAVGSGVTVSSSGSDAVSFSSGDGVDSFYSFMVKCVRIKVGLKTGPSIIWIFWKA
jgi:hypothetical protein